MRHARISFVRLALLFVVFVGTGALAQPIVGPEIASEPMRKPDTGVLARIAVSCDAQGTIAAWVGTNDRGLSRIFVAGLDSTNHVGGSVHEVPVAGAADVDVTAPEIASVGDVSMLVWLEHPAALSLIDGVISNIACARMDSQLNVAAPVVIGTTNKKTAILRAATDRFWIAAHSTLWQVGLNGAVDTPVDTGRSTDDMTTVSSLPQIVAHRVQTDYVGCACSVGSTRLGCGCPLYATHTYLTLISVYVAADEIQFDAAQQLPMAVRANPGRDALLVSFTSDREGYLYAWRLPSSLSVRPLPRPLTLGTFRGDTHAEIAIDGDRYVVVWQTFSSTGSRDIAGAVVNANGSVTPFAVAASVADEHDPSIVNQYPGGFLVTYMKDTDAGQQIAGRTILFLNGRRRTAP